MNDMDINVNRWGIFGEVTVIVNYRNEGTGNAHSSQLILLTFLDSLTT